MMPNQPVPTSSVQRQIVLPLSKAVEIAYKQIRLRLSRSLLVTSGIVLALAFLVSISASDALIRGMRDWMQQASASDRFTELRRRRATLEAELHPLETQIREAVRTAPKLAAGTKAFDDEAVLGKTLDDLREELGGLPAPESELRNALATRPELLEPFRAWRDKAADLHELRTELTAPQRLEAMMKSNGVPTTPQEIASNKIQTRWLLGLALLVAFVGILNAMLMSVTERFREIGTMKCLGALDSFIVKLFLIESLFQGVVGTTLGIIGGLALSFIGASTAYGGYAWKNVPWGELGWAVLVSLLVGIALTVAGAVYPAWQAARMQPIEAMRVET